MAAKRKRTAEEFQWEKDTLLGVPRRKYDSYQQYLDHQASKLGKVGEPIFKHDQLYETIVKERYSGLGEFSHKRVICLGARLGGEVRAFKSLGALAIGVDIEPGDKNPDVLYGDFHDLRFPDGSFDIAFTNVMDHVFDLEQFLVEVDRVLTPKGILFIELAGGGSGEYEVVDLDEPGALMKILALRFSIESQEEIVNTTNYVHWEGNLIKLRKAEMMESAVK